MLRVLIAEDHEGMRRALCDICALGGFAFDAIGDGRLVVDTARRFRPDVILLDLFLPGSHGRAVLDQLRAGPGPHIPVVVLSITPEVLQPPSLADRVLRKPVDIDELISTIRSLAPLPAC